MWSCLKTLFAKHASILRANLNRDPLKPCVYVGMTWVVKKYGVRLIPKLYEHLNLMPFEGAAQMEIELAEDLRTEAYTVTVATIT